MADRAVVEPIMIVGAGREVWVRPTITVGVWAAAAVVGGEALFTGALVTIPVDVVGVIDSVTIPIVSVRLLESQIRQ